MKILILIFSLLITYQVNSEEVPSLMDYAERTFRMDFDKMVIDDFMFIVTRCTALYSLIEQMRPSDKDKKLEMGAMLLDALETLYPEKSEDERWDMFVERQTPDYSLYLEESKKHYSKYGKTFSDLHIDDLAFCNLMLDPEVADLLLSDNN